MTSPPSWRGRCHALRRLALTTVLALACVTLASRGGEGAEGAEGASSYVMLFFDTPTVEGALSAGQVLQTISGDDDALRACLAASTSGTRDIELVASMRLAGDGAVQSTAVHARGNRDLQVEQCADNVLKLLRFKETGETGSSAHVVLRLVAMEEPEPRDAAVLVASAGGGVLVGSRAPALGLEELRNAPDGATATWEALRGNVVVIEFWATWCGPCVAEIPHLNELAAQFAGDDVVFLAITDENRETVERFLERRPIDGWQGFDHDSSSFDAYQIHGIPVTVVVDPEGMVAAVTHPGSLTAQTIRDLLP